MGSVLEHRSSSNSMIQLDGNNDSIKLRQSSECIKYNIGIGADGDKLGNDEKHCSDEKMTSKAPPSLSFPPSPRSSARICSWIYACCSRKQSTGDAAATDSGEFSTCQIIILGQVLSFLVASAGAAQGTLELDCHLSAPSLSVTPFYFCLATGLIPLYYLHRNRGISSNVKCAYSKKTDADLNVELQRESSSSLDITGLDVANAPQLFSDANGINDNIDASESDGWHSNNSVSPEFRHTFLRLIPISRPVYVYALVSLADFYANYFTVLAFRYTTITSVAITDAFAIPSAMVLSCCWFGRKYGLWHFLGIAGCMTGIALNVYQDYQKRSDNSNDINGSSTEDDSGHDRLLDSIDEAYPHKTLGDTLGLFGGILFGVSNTLAEYIVSDPSTTPAIANMEFLSMLGFFASIICVLQVSILEKDRVTHFFFFMNSDAADESCSGGKAFGLWMGFSLCCLMIYIGNARFLQISEAVFLNLSLLTGDFWTVLFSVVAEHIRPLPLFYPSLVLIVGGTIFYEMASSPDSETCHDPSSIEEHGEKRFGTGHNKHMPISQQELELSDKAVTRSQQLEVV